MIMMTMILRSLEFAYTGNMKKNMRHMHHKCCIYAPLISPNSAYFSTYFALKSSAYFNKILRYKPTSLIVSNFHKFDSS